MKSVKLNKVLCQSVPSQGTPNVGTKYVNLTKWIKERALLQADEILQLPFLPAR